MVKQVLKFSAGVGASLVLLTGVASAAPSIGNTGNGSTNKIKSKNVVKCKLINKNTVVVSSSNVQATSTGKATVKWNTGSGNAVSGDAVNSNSTGLTLGVTNEPTDSCSCGCSEVATLDGTINATGKDSLNVISWWNVNKQKTVNNNNVAVYNSSIQSASTGNASVNGNTTGGNATSGNASNTNSTGLVVTVSNN